jgi:hypothetical protein
LAVKAGIPRTSVILKDELGLHPYKEQARQELLPIHKSKRLAACKEFQRRFSNNRHRLILFSDEKWFVAEQAHNRQNDRVWATEAPPIETLVVGRAQAPKKVMVWAAVGYGMKPDIFFMEEGRTMDQRYYRRQVLRRTLRRWAQEHFGNGEEWIFQQDGAPSHTATRTQEWCQRNVPDFITKTQWPPRSPDLNPLDYSIWSILETALGARHFSTIEELKEAVREAWEALDQSLINRIVNSFPDRVRDCIRARGGHFE